MTQAAGVLVQPILADLVKNFGQKLGRSPAKLEIIQIKMAVMTYLEMAIADNHAQLVGEGKQQKIIYAAKNHTERYSDPEEKVRAEFWAELIYVYSYAPHRIEIEITVPDRTPSDRADLVIFHDDECKRPYAVIECKRDGITDSEFNQAIASMQILIV